MTDFIFSCVYSGKTDQGRVRSNNEDTYICQQIWDESYILCAAIDGLGGYEGGEVAAQLARSTIIAHLEDFGRECHVSAFNKVGAALKAALIEANNEIIRQHEARPKVSQMGCVASVGIIDLSQGIISIAHVGDSRIYQFAGGELKKLTHDHSLVGYREETGELSEEDAMNHPRRNVIDKFLGERRLNFDTEGYIEVSVWPIKCDTQYLFCSDGLTDLVKSGEISGILSSSLSVEEKVQKLIAAANDAGGKDNITVVVADVEVDIKGGPKEEETPKEEQPPVTPPTPTDPGKKRSGSKLRSLLLVLLGIIIGVGISAGYYYHRYRTGHGSQVLDVKTSPESYEDLRALKDIVRELKDSIGKMTYNNDSLRTMGYDIDELLKEASKGKQLRLKLESILKEN